MLWSGFCRAGERNHDEQMDMIKVTGQEQFGCGSNSERLKLWYFWRHFFLTVFGTISAIAAFGTTGSLKTTALNLQQS